MGNTSRDELFLKTKLRKNPNYVALVGSEKSNFDGKVSIYPKGVNVNNQ